jgi:hypothetical protein
MATVFWGRKRVLMVECMQSGTTMTSEVYCETKKLHRVIQKKKAWNSVSYLTTLLTASDLAPSD